PGQLENTRRVIDYVARRFSPGEVKFSLMSQYTPQPGATGAMARRLTGAEYRAARDYMAACGIDDGFCQERSSAKEEYTPDFDLSGV
ncbi:MAG: radical SAM protein, partial [Oscillospiraceae bacterium]|nr:radical SAM protein [Oscillospiraceae bacterium]